MTRRRDDLSESFATDDSGGWLSRLLADEDEIDRRGMWRLGSWAVGSVGAVVLAILATQSSTQTKRDQVAAADLARQAQLIQRVAKETQIETGRLASAIDTLNGDRDRLYSRLGSLEQGLDSVTGSIAQQKVQAAAAPPPAPDKLAAATPPAVSPPDTKAAAPAPPPIAPVESKSAALPPAEPKPTAAPPVEARPAAVAPIDTKPVAAASAEPKPAAAAPADSPVAPKAKSTPEPQAATASPATPLMQQKSLMAPPDPAAAKLIEPPSSTARAAMTTTEPDSEADDADPPAVPVQRTEFGVDLGGANSIDGLRGLWQRLLKSNKVLAALRPIIMVKEGPGGGGAHLRLVAGPLSDAATAAKFCAILSGGDRYCQTTVFDGQRLAISSAPSSAKPPRKRGFAPKVTTAPEPPPAPAPEPKSPSLTSILGLAR